jgi:hypothetical protein
MSLILRWLLNTLALFIVVKLVPRNASWMNWRSARLS